MKVIHTHHKKALYKPKGSKKSKTTATHRPIPQKGGSGESG